MEKRILVVDSPTSVNTHYFERTFANSPYDCRIVTAAEKLPPLIENLRFTYIFIGDVEDLAWLRTYKFVGMAYIVFYSNDSELVEKQRNFVHECSIVSIGMMNRFLAGMDIINAKATAVNPSLLF